MRRTDFYPRPPRGGRPRRGRCSRSVMLISIHALREEGDVLGIGQSWPDGDFYPRPPRGGRPILAALLTYALRNFYPRPPRGGRQHIDELREIAVEISIHALREEGDQRQPCIVAKLLYFYPRPPRGGRPSGGFAMGYVTKFLSTPSARRATQSGKTCTCVPSNFYPRPPRGGRHAHISIPAPFAQFLSTPSARRATYKRTELEPSMDISIHALREEGDSRRKRSKSNLKYFYPRPPRGGRPRRATDAKHRGSDFYPRPPRGGRRWMAVWLQSG